MGRVISLNGRAAPAEGSLAEDQQVKALYKKIEASTRGFHEIIVCKAIAVYMGTRMAKSKHPDQVIGGFMKHITECANHAIAYHYQKGTLNAPKDSKQAEAGQQGPQDASPPEGGDRSLEVTEEQEVLLSPALEQREGDHGQRPGVRPPGEPDGNVAGDGGDLPSGPIQDH